MKNNIFSNFKEIGISLISYSFKDLDDELKMIYNNILKNSFVITDKFNYNSVISNEYSIINDVNDDAILNTLNKLNDKSVFVSIPIYEWMTDNIDNPDNPDYYYMKRVKILSYLIKKISDISYQRKLSIILITQTYNGVSNTNYPSITPSKLYMISNFWINYEKNGVINILKNRYGDSNIKYNLKDIFKNEYREKKLKRIHKNL